MQCRTHPAVTAVNTCNTCGEWLCTECTLNINGRNYCRACLVNFAASEGAAPPPPRYFVPPPRPVKCPSGFLTFVFSFFPGANYMYLGLMKRGLAAMCGFFLLIYMLTLVSGSVFGGPLTVLLGLALPVCYLSYMFDGFNVRRRMMAGEVVPDGIEDVLAFLQRNKKPLLTLLILCLALGAAGSVINVIISPFLNLVPLLIIGLVLYILLKKKTE